MLKYCSITYSLTSDIMSSYSKKTIGRGAAGVYLETITVMILGYAFWIAMSKTTSPSVLGAASAVVTISIIFSIVAGLGIPNGIQRFLGKSFSSPYEGDSSIWIKTSLFLTACGIGISIFITYLLYSTIIKTFEIDLTLLIISNVLIVATCITALLRSIVISSMNTKPLPLIMIFSSSVKIVLGIFLVMGGVGAVGVTIAFTSNNILASALLAIVIIVSTRSIRHTHAQTPSIFKACKLLISASSVNWIPLLITTVGSQLGTLVVFGSTGSEKAAIYFMALTIVNGVTGVMFSLLTISLPAMSAMSDGRKRFAWQCIRLSLIIALPFSFSLVFYSPEIMNLVGAKYRQGGIDLFLMLFSVMPTAIFTGISSLVFAYGNYKIVLGIGLSTSIPRTVLYFLLVPLFADIGAASAYTIGAISGLVYSAYIAKRIGLKLYWKHLVLILAVPLLISFMFKSLGVNYIVAIILTLVFTYMAYYKIHVLTKKDFETIFAVLPAKSSETVTRVFGFMRRRK